MVAPITDAQARAFAEQLILHNGNATKAAKACGYGNRKSVGQSAFNLTRNPKVLAILQPLAQAQLQSLTPRAIMALAQLLSDKSGYIRLEAAKDILNRNGVGTDHKPLQSQPFLIRINLGSPAQRAGQQVAPDSPVITYHGAQSESASSINALAIPSEAVSAASPDPKGSGLRRALKLDLEDE